jgi:radical SAM superfamily enzyme YgiQ (UPF0313 family)
MNSEKKQKPFGNKILLALLPYWTPSIPPLGISCLKSHLQNNGYEVTTIDANMEDNFREMYDLYFEYVRECIPQERRGNFFNMGMDVMRNHMMAHINYTDELEYIALVKILFAKTFYHELDDKQVWNLNSILDQFYERLEIFMKELLERLKPTVLGLSVFSGSFPASLFAFQLAKKISPDIVTVLGGGIFSDQLAEGTPDYEYMLNNTPYIDKFIIGEGETTFLKFLEGEMPESQRVYTLLDINKETIDINKSSTPDFQDLNLSAYPQLGSYTSRSCPYQCSFCSETVHWGVYRKKTPENIVSELKHLYHAHGHQLFMMGDSLLNIVVDGLSKAFIKEDINLYWDGYIRADPPVCNIDNTLLWRQGGFYRARLGVESGSEHVLNLMNKKITVEQIKAAIRSLAQAGIKTTTYWVVGHPEETEEDFQMTLDVIEELSDDIWEAECNPFNYYLRGQVDSDKWMSEYKRVTLYPPEAQSMLISQTWIMKDCHPVREEIYSRVNRFVNHCKKLGIPNPYFLHEIHQADERWKRLHSNAVPALVDFKNHNNYIRENKSVKKIISANVTVDEGDFSF